MRCMDVGGSNLSPITGRRDTLVTHSIRLRLTILLSFVIAFIPIKRILSVIEVHQTRSQHKRTSVAGRRADQVSGSQSREPEPQFTKLAK
jgi:hypothetical protein